MIHSAGSSISSFPLIFTASGLSSSFSLMFFFPSPLWIRIVPFFASSYLLLELCQFKWFWANNQFEFNLRERMSKWEEEPNTASSDRIFLVWISSRMSFHVGSCCLLLRLTMLHYHMLLLWTSMPFTGFSPILSASDNVYLTLWNCWSIQMEWNRIAWNGMEWRWNGIVLGADFSHCKLST